MRLVDQQAHVSIDVRWSPVRRVPFLSQRPVRVIRAPTTCRQGLGETSVIAGFQDLWVGVWLDYPRVARLTQAVRRGVEEPGRAPEHHRD